MPSRNLWVILVASLVSVACYAKAERNRYVATLAEAMALIANNYVEPVESRDLFEGAMEGMVGSLEDQYSNYISPQDFTEFQESLDQEFGGVGIVVETHPTTQFLTVVTPLVNTPAYEAGLQAGDMILSINGKTTREIAMSQAVDLMRGKPGSEVRLTIQRDPEPVPHEFRIRRAIIPVESVLGDTRRRDGSWNFFLEENPRIGYVRLTTFGDHTVEELRRALAQFEQRPIEALLLDLRGNAGGYLSAAVAVSNMFIDEGRIVSTRGRDGSVRAAYEADAAATIFPQDTPMVVLVNRDTASASEIVAACLQDHGRAAVAGVRSWGKGTVQNVIQLEGGSSALKLTTASYWRPSGKNIHRGKDVGENGDWGVQPNAGLEVVLDDATLQELHRLRRLRDIVLRPAQRLPTWMETLWAANQAEETPADQDDAPNDQDTESRSPAVTITQWSDDPQLQRAIEHLQKQIKARKVAASELDHVLQGREAESM